MSTTSTHSPLNRSRLSGLSSSGSLARTIVAAALIAGVPAASFAQVRLAGDAHTSSATPTTKLGTNGALTVSAAGNAYLVFDFSSLPIETTGADVNKAVLMVWVSKVAAPGKVMVTRLQGPWSEATIVHNTTPPIGSDEVTNIAVSKAKQFITIDVTQLVQDTLDLTYPNYGLAIVPQDAGVDAAFDSKESTTTSHEPRLTLYLRSEGTVAAGGDNVFAGTGSGQSNTGEGNTFVGAQSGLNSSTGHSNTFIGTGAGNTNTTESGNTLLGALADIRYPAGAAAGAITNATAIGVGAIVSKSNSLVLGHGANVGIGTSSPSSALDVVGDIRFGSGGLGCIMDRSGEVIAGKCASVPEQFIARLDIPAIGVRWVPVKSFSSGVERVGGESSGQDHPSSLQLSIERIPDHLSPIFMTELVKGTRLDRVYLEILRASDRVRVVTYEIQDAFLAKFSASAAATDNRTEIIELGVIDRPLQVHTDGGGRTLPMGSRPIVARCTLTDSSGSVGRTFDVLDYAWDVTMALSLDPTKPSKTQTRPFELTKAVGVHSQSLWSDAFSGNRVRSAVIDVFAPDGTTAVRYTLTDAYLKQMTFGGRGADVNVPTEDLSFSFAKITMQTTAPNGTTITRTWDYSQNTVH